MARRNRKQKAAKAKWLLGGATIVAGAAAALKLRSRGGGGEDRVSAAPAAVVEPGDRGHSTDAVERPAPVRQPDAGPPSGEPVVDHPAPAGSVVPDQSGGDPLVDEQTSAAAAQAASIGGEVEIPGGGDPAMRPVVEGSGDAEESFEASETDAATDREKRP